YVAPFDHAKPAWFYLSDVALGMLPWSLLIPAFVVYLFSRRSTSASRPRALGLFVLSAGWCFLFYSLAGSKRSGYILPAMAPLALALGCYVDALVRSLRVSENLLVLQRGCSWAARFGSYVLTGGLGFGVLGLTTGYLRVGPALLLASLGF